MKLSGRVAVVTGAGSGIGRALARRFGSEGMSVLATDIDEARLVVAGRTRARREHRLDLPGWCPTVTSTR